MPRFVFFGTPEFSRIVLEELAEAGLLPAAIVTNPDKPVGRRKVLAAPPAKQFVLDRSMEQQIKILQPAKLSEAADELKALQPDLFVVAVYAKIIPQSVLDIPRLGTIGVHPSLLPLYRGSSPVQTALLEGAEKTGVTIFLLDEKMDHGPILAQKEASIGPDDTNKTLMASMAHLAGKMLAETLPRYVAGEIKSQQQDHSRATVTGKFSTADAFIEEAELKQALNGSNPELAKKIHNRIRAFGVEPGAWTLHNGKRLKLLESNVEGGKLKLLRVQLEGKTPTSSYTL